MRRALLLTAAAIGLAACGPVNRGVETVHQPVVNRGDYVLDLGEAGSRLAPGEDLRLIAWFDSLRVGYGDRVSLDDPSPNRATREAVATVAARYGLLLADAAPVTAGEIAPSSVRVVLTRSFAHVMGCPDWRRPSVPEFESSNNSNYGCAINSNLAAMVANPMDLVRGAMSDSSDPLTAARSIKSYREAAPTGAGGAVKAESSKGGN